jgi:hypothetical protein
LNENEDFLEGLARQVARDARLASRGFGFEGQVVSHLLKVFGLRGEEHVLRQRCEEQTGRRNLLFSRFYDAHQDFPVWIAARKFKIDVIRQFESRVRLAAPRRTGVKTVCRSKLFVAFDAVRESAPLGWEGPVALVFYQTHNGRLLKVIHDADLPMQGWRQQIEAQPQGSDKRVVTVEDFDTMLSGLRWSP